MEALLLLGLIAILLILITGNNRLNARLRELEGEIASLRHTLKDLVLSPKDTARRTTESSAQKPITRPYEAADLQQWAPKPDTPIPAPLSKSDVPQQPIPQVPKSLSQPLPVTAPSLPPLPPRPGFFERHPDLERFIGEALIPKIGIAILVIAIGFFVKYAIDQNWIGPAGRVGIGILCGGILVGLAHRLQKNYGAFASVLVGGGLAVFYFSIALAYKDYGLFSQTVTFIIMVVITVFAILLSLLYNRQVVAIIALAGGFAVPFLVSNGSGNYITLFSYLLLLNGGLLIIAYRKAWRLLNGIAFGATAILFAGWLTTIPIAAPQATFIGGFLFAMAFYLLFVAINLAHNIRERKRFIASDFGILLANNCFYFSAGLYLLYGAHAAAYKGLFSASLGALNCALVAVLLRRKAIDTAILYLLVGVTLTFVSLAAPLQLQGHFITLFWAAESVVLLFIFQKSRIRILQWGLLAVWACSIASLMMDWAAVYDHNAMMMRVISNRGFMTTLFVAAANAVLYWLLRRKDTEAPLGALVSAKRLADIAGGCAIILLYAAGALEIAHQFGSRFAGYSLGSIYEPAFAAAFVLALSILQRRGLLRMAEVLLMVLIGVCLFAYLLAIQDAYQVQEHVLQSGVHRAHYIAHWCGAALVGMLFYELVRRLRRRHTDTVFITAVTWAGAAFAVVFVSVEVQLLTTAILFGPGRQPDLISQGYIRAGLPVVWGLCSFALMWIGMQQAFRPLRIASLALFSITLVKLFVFDIQKVGAAGKIAAFFSLGVLLLVVSFMYQRLKKLIISDTPADELKADEDATT